MTQNASAATKIWSRPSAQRLGRIGDVAGAPGGNVNNGTNTNRS